jgi:hypothetical protein
VVLDLAEHEIVANTISLFLIVQSGAWNIMSSYNDISQVSIAHGTNANDKYMVIRELSTNHLTIMMQHLQLEKNNDSDTNDSLLRPICVPSWAVSMISVSVLMQPVHQTLVLSNTEQSILLPIQNSLWDDHMLDEVQIWQNFCE